jgi:hypothetical protein
MYHRFDSSILPKENISNTLTHLIDHTISLNDHARLLEKVIRNKNHFCYPFFLLFSVFENFIQYLRMNLMMNK